MSASHLGLALILVLGVGCGGCATLVSGTDDVVTIDARPSGARCIIKQGDVTVGVVDPTPGTISVEKSRQDLSVRCELEGYEPAVGAVGSEFQPMTFGNVLFGGLIGVGIGAASGAMTNYEPVITITMLPQTFGSAEERDRFFDELRTEFLGEYEATRGRIVEQCGSDSASCARQLELAEQQKEVKLREIESKRLAAPVSK